MDDMHKERQTGRTEGCVCLLDRCFKALKKVKEQVCDLNGKGVASICIVRTF